jgi:hypothetical protein
MSACEHDVVTEAEPDETGRWTVWRCAECHTVTGETA